MAGLVEPLPPGAPEWPHICRLFTVTDPQNIGWGLDVQEKEKHKGITPLCAWRIASASRRQKYDIARQEVASNIRAVSKFAGLPSMETKLDQAATALSVDDRVNEKFLLHGTKALNVLTILHNGLNERFSGGPFGLGVYLAEDASKMDQYCTSDLGSGTPGGHLEKLHEELYGRTGLPHPGRVFYAVCCRVALGFPIYTKDGQVNLHPPGQALYATSDTRELAVIPGSEPPVHYHSLVVECGPRARGFKLERHREFVVFHSDHILEEFLVAYRRDAVSGGDPEPFPAAAFATPFAPSPDVSPGSGPRLAAAAAGGAAVLVHVAPAAHVPEWARTAAELCSSLDAKAAARLGTDSAGAEVGLVLRNRALRIHHLLVAGCVSELESGLMARLTQCLRETVAEVDRGRPGGLCPLLERAKDLQLLIQELTLEVGVVMAGRRPPEVSHSASKPFQRWEMERSNTDPKDAPRRSLLIPLNNSRYSLRAQVALVVGFAALVASIVFILGCVPAVAGLAVNMKDMVRNSLRDNAKTAMLTISRETASAIDAQLRATGEGISMALAEQAEVLLTSNAALLNGVPSTLLKPRGPFAEFGFGVGCNRGLPPFGCPADYGPLAGRSRLTDLDGSLENSAMYAYSSNPAAAGVPRTAANGGAEDTVSWTGYLQASAALNVSIQALSILDLDLRTLYELGPVTTLQMYVGLQLYTASGQYYSLKQTYPGYALGQDTYQPPSRGWFKWAPQDAIYMDGPYVETVTRNFVVTLSSKRSFPAQVNDGRDTVAVGATVMLLSDLEQLTRNVGYLQSGFGVLAKRTGEVIVWGEPGSTFEPYNAASSIFRKLQDADAALSSALGDVLSGREGTFEYTKQSPGPGQGELWFVSYVPTFATKKDGDVQDSLALVFLMFARQREVLATVPALETDIDRTTSGVMASVVIGVAVVLAIVMCAAGLVGLAISPPLRFLLQTSRQVVQAAANEPEDGAGRCTAVVESMPKLSAHAREAAKMSELGRLQVHFQDMMVRLGRVEFAKMAKPKYPPNPFCGKRDAVLSGHFNELLDNANRTAMIPGGRTAFEAEADKLVAETVGEVPATPGGTACCAKMLGSLKNMQVMACTVALLLIIGLAVVAGVTQKRLSSEGSRWAIDTGNHVREEEGANLALVASAKSAFGASFYGRSVADSLTVALFTSQLLAGNLTRDDWRNHPLLPTSYSLDCACSPSPPKGNFYAYGCSGSCTFDESWRRMHSGYFSKTDADCRTQPRCQPTHDSNLTKLTSILELKARGVRHLRSPLDFVQFGFEDTSALTRIYPYQYTLYGYASTCQADVDPSALPAQYGYCETAVQQCASRPGLYYPPYDPRCRSWYQTAVAARDPSQIVFQLPRRSSSGNVVVSAVTTITSDGTADGTLLAVVNMNLRAASLADSVNGLQLFRTGYSFVVVTSDPSSVVLHPRLDSSGCVVSGARTPPQLRCMETGFSSEEWASFQATVFPALQANEGSHRVHRSTYQKGGVDWELAAAPMEFGSARYTMMVTVPTTEVLEVVHKAENQVSSALTSQLAVFITTIVFVFLFAGLLLFMLVRAVNRPIQQLIAFCEFVAKGDLTAAKAPVPSSATSSEMLVLLKAFSSMLVAFKFGSESYAKGDMRKALAAFREAVQLFALSCNDRGLGIAHNNAAAVQTALGNFDEATAGYVLSIGLAEAQVEEAKLLGGAQADRNVARARRTLSNRLGNYASVLIEMGDDAAEDPFEILQRGQQMDVDIVNRYGWVVKQGLIGHFYLKQGELKEAEDAFRASLAYVLGAARETWDPTEAAVAEQVSRYNLARALVKKESETKQEAWEMLAECLGNAAVHDARTTAKAVSLLLEIVQNRGQAEALARLAEKLGVQLGGGRNAKRVAFCLDYSGSMAGSKIKAAVSALLQVFEENINDQDLVSMMHFNNQMLQDFPMSPKIENIEAKRCAIAALTRPSAGTRFYDSVAAAIIELKLAALAVVPGEPASFTNWVVALTDGVDNASTTSYPALSIKLKEVRESLTGLIIVGVGDEVEKEKLLALAQCTSKGAFLFADGSAESISAAFSQVAKLIEGHVILEDF